MESLIFHSFSKKINYKHLKINYENIKHFSKNFDDFYIPNWSEDVFYNDTFENSIKFIFLINTINFSYWSDKNNPKWFYISNNTKYTGSFALFSALKNALNDGYELFNPIFLKNLSENDLKNILEKYEKIPMFQERLHILREIGENLLDKNLNSFFDIFKLANNSSVSLIEIIIKIFPSFDDSFFYQGNKYNFFKRAQLIPAMIYGKYQTQKLFNDIDCLTVFSDYRVPQTLRKLGLVDYNDNLSKKIQDRDYLEISSEQELEIRLSTIQSCLLIKELINNQKYINSLHIDYFLWKTGKKILQPDYDFHRTRTIFY